MADDILEEFLQFRNTEGTTQPAVYILSTDDNVEQKLRFGAIEADNLDFERELFTDDETSSTNSVMVGRDLPLMIEFSDNQTGEDDPFVQDNPTGEDNPTGGVNPIPELAGLWIKADTLELISLYHQMKDQFEPNNIKKIVLWRQVAEKIPPYTTRQCANWWKYLRKCYFEKIENMSSATTGKRRITFEYFDEMDAVLGQSYSVKPAFVSSLSRGPDNLPTVTTTGPNTTIGYPASASGYESGISDNP